MTTTHISSTSLGHEASEEYQILPFYEGEVSEFCGRTSLKPVGIVKGPRVIVGYLKKQYRLSCQKNARHTSHIKSFPLPALPIEIGLIIFGYLHPIDLYHLGLTSRHMRGIILNKSLSAAVWKKSFERHRDVPAPPRNIPEPRWTQLLFGPDICMVCGQNGAEAFFAFSKRYCSDCQKQFTAHTHDIRDHLGERLRFPNAVLPMLPRETDLTWGRNWYHLPDVNALMRRVALIQILIDHQVPRLARIFATDQKILKKRVAEIETSSLSAKFLLTRHRQRAYDELDVFAGLAVKRCSKWLTGLGYKPWDINASGLDSVLQSAGVHKATLRIFRRLLPTLEKEAICSKPRDVFLLQFRLAEMYEYYETSQEGARSTLPHSELAVDIFLKHHFDKSMKPDEIERQFFKVIAATAHKERLKCADRLPAHLLEPSPSEQDQLRKVDLAAATFSCRKCRHKTDAGIQIGWKAICHHMRNYTRGAHRGSCLEYDFNDKVSLFASSIVTLSGLDPNKACVDDMDEKNDRFICGICRPSRKHRISLLRTYTWFDLLLHLWHDHYRCLRVDSRASFVPTFHLLSPAARDFVLDHERLRFREKWRVWRCNKCHAHDVDWVSWHEVRNHASRKHLIDEPMIGKDILRMKHSPIRSRQWKFKLRVEPGFDCLCLRCPNSQKRTLFTGQVVLRHLKSSHAVSNPTKNLDWTQIQIIQGTHPSDLPYSNIRIQHVI